MVQPAPATRLYWTASGHYLPAQVADNAYFSQLTGREPVWFENLTGIRERRRAAADENCNSMAIAAVENMVAEGAGTGVNLLEGVDWVIGCSYTPWDTIGTMAHVVQRHFQIRGARALYISSACSSFIDALDVIRTYCLAGRSQRALVVAAEHNSLYARDADSQSGHLWGDGAFCALLETTPRAAVPAQFELVDSLTIGMGDVGHGPEGIYLHPRTDGLVMPHGRDVFHHACRGMEEVARQLLDRNNLRPGDLRLIVPHQANRRIIAKTCEQMDVPMERVALSIESLGNTGCASIGLTFRTRSPALNRGDRVLFLAFGGGYSAGAALLQAT